MNIIQNMMRLNRLLHMKKIISWWKNRIINDNRGVSLVELLVAITIGTIVSGSVASLLVFSLRMYGKQTVDVEMQQEMQTTSNFVIDSIMESDSFIVSKSKDTQNQERSDIVVLGKFEYSSSLLFSGYVFGIDNVDSTTKDGKLYMKKYAAKGLTSACVSSGETVPDKIVEELATGIVAEANLLATNVQIFNLTPTEDSVQEVSTPYTYSNPFSVNLDLQFAKNGGTSDVKKELHDTIAIRNTIKPINTTNITVGGVNKTVEMTPVAVGITNAWNQYYQHKLTSKKDELKIITETVQMQKVLGNITTSNSNNMGDFDILEIVPNYAYDYLRYLIAGTNGEIIYNNVQYGDTTYFTPLTEDDVYKYYNDKSSKYYFDQYFYANGGDRNALFFDWDWNEDKLIIRNNDLFKLYVLQDYIEPYAENKMLDIRYGRWENKSTICSTNDDAIRAWEEAGNKINLYVSTPEDLSNHSNWIDEADLILFGSTNSDDGAYSYIAQIYGAVHPEYSYSSQDGGDLNFENALKIYRRVVDKKACIVCPTAMNGYRDNINMLFKMLCLYTDNDVSLETIKNETYLNNKQSKISEQKKHVGYSYWDADGSYQSRVIERIKKVGSGRNAFKDMNTSSEIWEKINQMGAGNQNFVDYDLYLNQVRYNNQSDILSFNSNGYTGMLLLQAINQSIHGGSDEIIGEITILGAALDIDGRQGVEGGDKDNNPKHDDSKNTYSIDVVNMNTKVTITDKDTGEEVEIDRVMYLNDFEYEIAKSNKLKVFCLVKGTERDIAGEGRGLWINNQMIELYGAGKPTGTNWCSKNWIAMYNDTGLTLDNKPIAAIMECLCEYDINSLSLGPGEYDYIKTEGLIKSGERGHIEGTGNDYVLVVRRDLFDLD